MTETPVKPVVKIGVPIMSGFCSTPQTAHPEESHLRCHLTGGGSTANPEGRFNPCPCECHLGETYECGACGRPIREAPMLPLDYDDSEEGEMRYVHIDPKTGRSIGEYCP